MQPLMPYIGITMLWPRVIIAILVPREGVRVILPKAHPWIPPGVALKKSSVEYIEHNNVLGWLNI